MAVAGEIVLGPGISPLVEESDVKAVADQMRSMWIGRGERVKELESVIASWVHAKHALVLGSGTAALTMALLMQEGDRASYDFVDCDSVRLSVRYAGKSFGEGPRIAVYPDIAGEIIDFARHLPLRGTISIGHKLGIFSFGALKDVSGGLGGAVVSNSPLDHELSERFKRLSPVSDINAAMVLSQLSRYRGKNMRLVAEGKAWKL